MTQTRQMKELLNVCALHGIDSELLKRRAKTLLDFRQQGFAYRGYVEREFWMKTKKIMMPNFQSLRFMMN